MLDVEPHRYAYNEFRVICKRPEEVIEVVRVGGVSGKSGESHIVCLILSPVTRE